MRTASASLAFRVTCAAAFVGALWSTALGQTNTSWRGGPGSWNAAAKWTAGVPTATTNAQIDHLINISSTVTLSADGSVNNFTLDSDDQLDLAGHTLTVAGTSLTANGDIAASGPLSFTNAAGATISGAGTITATNNISTASAPLAIGSNNTVNLNSAGASGPYGQIHASSLTNNGTIVGGPLDQADIVATTISNSGTISSTFASLSLRSATITNNGLIEAIGNGSLVNLNTDNFAGGVTVTGSGGWDIEDGGINGLGAISIQTTGEVHISGSGLFTLGGGSSLSASVISGDGTIQAPNYTLSILNGDPSKPFSGSLGTGAKLIKTGAGTQVITSEQTYTGGTSIQGGTLEIDNPLPHGSGVGFGELDVENGGTLAGTGGAASFSFVKSGGILAPGSNGPGTLSFFGLTLEPGSQLDLDLGDNAPSDLVRNYDSAFAAEGVKVKINDIGLKVGVTTWFADWTGSLILQDGGITPGDFTLIDTPGIAGSFVVDNANNRVGFTPSTLPLYGDFNGDGLVDMADYVVWRKGLGTTFTQSDYDVWRTHFGQTAASGSSLSGKGAVVPEPAGLTLALLCILSALPFRRLPATGRYHAI